MDSHRQAAQFIRDLTHDFSHDLAPRAARASKESLKARFSRLRSRVYFILQCSIAAGLSWYVAQHLLGHQMPYLAPVAAFICLGLTFGQRWRRVFEVTVGVATGVLIGTAFAHYFGAGVWQIIVVAAAGMIIASLLGGGVLIASQAAVQGIIVLTLVGHPGEGGFDRWLDALVGAAVALIAATITPISPIEAPRNLAKRIGASMAHVLSESVEALREGNLERADGALSEARDSEAELAEFATATHEGMAVVRHSPLRRRRRESVASVAALAGPLDRAVRNIRVLVRRISTSIWRDDPVHPDVIDAIAELAVIIERMSQIADDEHISQWREEVTALGNKTAHLPMDSLSSAVLIAQLRSIVVDLLEMTGLSYEAARDQLGAYDDQIG